MKDYQRFINAAADYQNLIRTSALENLAYQQEELRARIMPATKQLELIKKIALLPATKQIATQQKMFAQMARASRIAALQETWQSIDNLIPAIQAVPHKADLTLSALQYIEENRPDICHQVDEVLSSSVDEEQSVDSLDGYIALCEELSANLAILYSTIDSSELAKGIACLAIVFADLLIYLKYCKSLKEKGTA